MGYAMLAWLHAAAATALHHVREDRRGQGTVEYVGVVVMVTLLIAAVAVAAKGWAPSVFLTVFQPLFFLSQGFQRIALQAFQARLGPGAWITSRTIVREPHHVRIGRGSLVGEYVHLVCSYQPRIGLLIVGEIAIGENVLVGAHSLIAAGSRVGAGTILEHAVNIGAGTVIGDNVRIGAGSCLYNRVQVGDGAVIGKNCVVCSGASILPGSRIPDGSLVPAELAEVNAA